LNEAPASADRPTEGPADTVLTIDLAAVAANYRGLQTLCGRSEVGAVVKANAYGLGLAPVARTLADAGCRSYFVADLGEGLELRALLPAATIYVLNGLSPHHADVFRQADLVPCLAHAEDVETWASLSRQRGPKPAALHFNTGINRLGMTAEEAAWLASRPQLLGALPVSLVMSHLACSDDAGHPMNRAQYEAFRALAALLPETRLSLANSGGIYLGPEYRFDLVRPGIALYGGSPFAAEEHPFSPVIELTSRILQVREIGAGEHVGYGATWESPSPRRIAIVAGGYADGLLRSLSSRGHVAIAGHIAPIVGRVSMDMITADVTDLPPAVLSRGREVELIGPHLPLETVARQAGTIGYEMLTQLGNRYRRVYQDGDAAHQRSLA